MASPEELEVYRQRYETYRHLDRLRWQLLQIVLAAIALALAFGNSRQTPTTDAQSSSPDAWLLFVAGVVLIVLGAVMQRIRSGIEANGRVLQRFGERVGDDAIPSPTSRSNSTSFWVGAAVIVAGAVCIGIAIF